MIILVKDANSKVRMSEALLASGFVPATSGVETGKSYEFPFVTTDILLLPDADVLLLPIRDPEFERSYLPSNPSDYIANKPFYDDLFSCNPDLVVKFYIPGMEVALAKDFISSYSAEAEEETLEGEAHAIFLDDGDGIVWVEANSGNYKRGYLSHSDNEHLTEVVKPLAFLTSVNTLPAVLERCFGCRIVQDIKPRSVERVIEVFKKTLSEQIELNSLMEGNDEIIF